MKAAHRICTAIACLLGVATANATIIGAYFDETSFTTATGATSLTGPLPNIGAQGNSVTLGGATLTAGNTIFVGQGWSTLLPGGNAIAISGPENLDVTVNTGLANAFGFYFHEPAASTGMLNGCNATCIDSTFTVDFLLGSVVVDSLSFFPPDDTLFFAGVLLDTIFDAVTFTEVIGGIDNEFFGEMFVANISVPEPGTLGLLCMGLLAAGALSRRRR